MSIEEEIRNVEWEGQERFEAFGNLEPKLTEALAAYVRSKMDALGEDCKRIARDDNELYTHADFARYDSKIDAAVLRAKGDV